METCNKHSSNHRRLVLEVVGVGALCAVKSKGFWVFGCDFGSGIRGWVGDAAGLALAASVDAVDEGEDEGGGGGKEDVAVKKLVEGFWQ